MCSLCYKSRLVIGDIPAPRDSTQVPASQALYVHGKRAGACTTASEITAEGPVLQHEVELRMTNSFRLDACLVARSHKTGYSIVW